MKLYEIADTLTDYRRTIKLLESLYSDLDISLCADTMINYRDALCHYVKCYENENTEEFIRQESNLYEHLDRGFKDGIIYLITTYSHIISHMMNNSNVPDLKVEALRACFHEFKNLSLDIRTKGIYVERIIGKNNTELEEFVRLGCTIKRFFILLNEDIQLKNCYGIAKRRKNV